MPHASFDLPGITSPTDPDAPSARWWEGAVLAVLALAIYALLRQGVIYGDDGIFALLNADKGNLRIHVHVLYLPLLALLRSVMEPLGYTLWETAAFYSALGMAMGVGFVHVACRELSMRRADAAAVTVLVALMPIPLFFATVVEKHGPGFAFDGLAFWMTARLINGPRWPRAALLGVATGVAFLAHAFAALLPAVVLSLLVAVRYGRGELRSRRELRQVFGLCLVVAAVHAVFVFAVPRGLAQHGFKQSTGGTLAFVMDLISYIDDVPVRIGWTLWSEWLAPWFPVSVVWLAGFAHRSTRPLALAVAAPLGAYLTMTFLMLSGLWIADYGAYMVSLSWPLALTIRAALPRPAFWATAAVGFAIGMYWIADFNEPERPQSYAAGFREVTGGDPALLLVGDTPDLEAIFIAMPEVPYLFVGELSAARPDQLEAVLLRQLDTYLAQQRSRGNRVFLTRLAEENLSHPEGRKVSESGYLILQHLIRTYRLEPVQALGFAGVEVLPR